MSRLDAERLLIIGTGSLGARVGVAWLRARPGNAVVAETASVRRHDSLRRMGLVARRRSEPAPRPAPHVLFSVPPTAVEDYEAEAHRASALWDGSGRLVMVSSTAVYAEQDGGSCGATAPVADTEPAGRLLRAEKPVLAAGGCVVRMAGLYDLDRGPHRVFLREETSPRRGDGLVNLIHYEDAAELCVRALAAGEAAAIYLGSDDAPITRQRLADAAAGSGLFAGSETATGCRFLGSEGPLGRRCDSRETRDRLGWQPRHSSFVAWLEGERRYRMRDG